MASLASKTLVQAASQKYDYTESYSFKEGALPDGVLDTISTLKDKIKKLQAKLQKAGLASIEKKGYEDEIKQYQKDIKQLELDNAYMSGVIATQKNQINKLNNEVESGDSGLDWIGKPCYRGCKSFYRYE